MSSQIAQTILQQLGAGRFVVMTGAKQMTASPDALNFRLPSNFAKDGINQVTVRLDEGRDLYVITYRKIRGVKVTTVREDDGVYADMLRRSFTDATGLDTSL